MSWLDKVEEDLKHASENGDRSAQSRLYGHAIPEMIRQLRELEPVAIEVEEVEEVVEEEEEEDSVEE